MITYDLNLCIGMAEQGKSVAVKCHDTGVNLRVWLSVMVQKTWRAETEPYTIPDGSTAVLKIAKPDKTFVIVDGEITGGHLFFELPPQTFTAAGTAEAEVSLFDADGRRLTTATFDIEVPEECVCDCKEESKTYVDIMSKQIQKAVDAADAAKAAAERAEKIYPQSIFVDVVDLPTENIKEEVLYRLLTGGFIHDRVVNTAHTCHCVDSLPEVGDPALSGSGSPSPIGSVAITAYYSVSDGDAYGYVTEKLSGITGKPVGWHPLSSLVTYGGIITDILDDPRDGALRLLLKYDVFAHKGKWTSLEPVGMVGAAPYAETFNHVSNIASGKFSHAEGASTEARGDYSHAEGGDTEATGAYSHAEGRASIAGGTASHAEGASTEASGGYSHAEGANTKASGENSHAEGAYSKASGAYSHAEGVSTEASGAYSHAEGASTKASGAYSHSEGVSTEASGGHSHAEGSHTKASGVDGHAEGTHSKASGDYSHAEGGATEASGIYSHAEGGSTKARGAYSHVQGRFNIEDTKNKYAHIVGNGNAAARSNAHTLDWEGNAWYAGSVEGTKLILKSPNGTRYEITVSDDGTLQSRPVR